MNSNLMDRSDIFCDDEFVYTTLLFEYMSANYWTMLLYYYLDASLTVFNISFEFFILFSRIRNHVI